MGEFEVICDGGDVRSLPLKGWNMLQSVNWAPDGNCLYVSGGRALTESSAEWAIFEGNLRGNFKVLIQIPNNQGWVFNPIPSPDGRFLTFTERNTAGSVMMLENF